MKIRLQWQSDELRNHSLTGSGSELTGRKKDAAGLVRHIGTLYRDGETLKRGLFYRGRSFGMPGSIPLYRFIIDVHPDYIRINVFEMRMVEAG